MYPKPPYDPDDYEDQDRLDFDWDRSYTGDEED